MAIVSSDLGRFGVTTERAPKGPITAARQRRTWMIYGAMCVLGPLPALIGASPSWQAAGLGLWMPGAGFVAVGVLGQNLLERHFAVELAIAR